VRSNSFGSICAGVVNSKPSYIWNAKRLRDADLLPYDYRGEDYTRLLWFHEGFTETMEQQALLRARLLVDADYLKDLATGWTGYLKHPGRNHSPLTELSHDAWTKAYKPSPSHGNTVISYYEKGHYLGVCLDLELRLRSAEHGHKGSLTGLFRRLMASHGARGKGLTHGRHRRGRQRRGRRAHGRLLRPPRRRRRRAPAPRAAHQDRRARHQRGRPASPTAASSSRAIAASKTSSPAAPPPPPASCSATSWSPSPACACAPATRPSLASASARPASASSSRCFAAARLELRSLTLAADPHRTWRFERAADAALSPEVIGLRRAWLARDEK
jgi:hypothetical protein